MEAKAHLRYARISPRKVQIVCDLIRGKSVAQATAILMATPKAASELLLKLLKSAAANAENNHQMDPEKLYVSAAVRHPRPHHQADDAPGPGPRLSDQQAHFSHHHRGGRALREEEEYGTESESPRPARGCHQGLGLPLVCPQREGGRPAGGGQEDPGLPEEDPVFRRYPQDRDRARQRQGAHLPALRPPRRGHRQGRRGDRGTAA